MTCPICSRPDAPPNSAFSGTCSANCEITHLRRFHAKQGCTGIVHVDERDGFVVRRCNECNTTERIAVSLAA